MKRTMAAILAFVVAGAALTGCTTGKTTPQSSPATTGSAVGEAERDMASDVGQAAGNAVEGMVEGAGEMVASAADAVTRMMTAMGDGMRDMMDVADGDYMETYGIDRGKYEDVAIKAVSDDPEAGEIIMIRAKDEENLRQAVTDLESRRSALEEQWGLQTGEDKTAKKAVIKTRGNYAVLVVAEDGEAAEKAFDSLPI